RGLDDDVVGALVAGEQLLHGGNEVVGHGAADAAIGELDHVLLAAGLVAATGKNLPVDTELPELVDDQRDALAPGMGEQVAHQRGLAGAEEAGNDGDGDLGAGELFHAWAPFRASASARAKRWLSQPSSGP